MNMNATKSGLTPACGRFIDLMQRINFGRIEGLHVLDGEPLLEPPPRVIHEVKFCRENGPRAEAARAEFALKAEVIDLFAHMEALGSGVIERIEIQHGLPFRMTYVEVFA